MTPRPAQRLESKLPRAAVRVATLRPAERAGAVREIAAAATESRIDAGAGTVPVSLPEPALAAAIRQLK